MSFLKKFIDFCTKAKGKIVAFKTKAYRFIEANKKEIKALMKFLQFTFTVIASLEFLFCFVHPLLNAFTSDLYNDE